jgi:uncharacterized caspase-like protein
MGWLRSLFALPFALFCLSVAAHAEKRVALVIGNSAYEHVPALANPKNDAGDMAAKLEGLGFEVVRGSDLSLADMRKTAREFTNKLEGADLSLFFYAGHGLQVNGNNYMAPIDAQLNNYNDLDYEVLPMDLIVSAMERNTKTNLVFLDACRDNPLAENLARSMGTRSGAVGRGLAKLGSGIGTLIAFATQPGNVALDGTGRNSPFTTALLKHLGTPGQSITDELIQVRREVLTATQGKQVPWDNSSLTGEVILKEAPKDEPKIDPAPEVKAPQQSDSAIELAYWDSIKDSEDTRLLQTYLDQYPDGAFARLAQVKIELLKAQGDGNKQKQPAQSDNSAEVAYWNSIKDSGGTAYLEAYLQQYPNGSFAGLARVRIAEIKTAEERAKQEATAKAEAEARPKTEADQKPVEVAKLEEPATRSLDPVEMALETQKELIRLGCLSGKADGEWGVGSQKALKDYAGRQGIRLASLDPAADVLDRLKATTVRVCPLVCGKGMEERNGRCEKVKREASVPKQDPAREKAAPETGSAKDVQKSQSASSAGKLCFRCKKGNGAVETVCGRPNDPEFLARTGTVEAACTRL